MRISDKQLRLYMCHYDEDSLCYVERGGVRRDSDPCNCSSCVMDKTRAALAKEVWYLRKAWRVRAEEDDREREMREHEYEVNARDQEGCP